MECTAFASRHNTWRCHERRGSTKRQRAQLNTRAGDANVAHLHKNLGDYHYRVQRYDEACDDFLRVVRLAPLHGADVHLKLGNIHFRRGAVDEARACWEQALLLEPDNRIVQANLSAVRGKPVLPTPVGASAAA